MTDRRSFIKRSWAALAGLAVAPLAAQAPRIVAAEPLLPALPSEPLGGFLVPPEHVAELQRIFNGETAKWLEVRIPAEILPIEEVARQRGVTL